MPMKSTARRAFTLVEILMVIVMLGMVMAVMMKVIVGQQRFYRGTADIAETRTSVRDAVSLLKSELRALSPSSGEIISMSSSSIDFWAPIAVSVVCNIASGRSTFTVPPLTLAINNSMTSWITPPQKGDSVLVVDLGAKDGTADDKWVGYRMNSNASPNASCPVTSFLTTTAAEAAQGWTIPINTTLAPKVAPGSAVRVLRHAHYELYQASDGNWYLGYYDCPDNVCTTIQPVSGPYLPPSASGASGLTLTYYDNTGALLDPSVAANRFAVARIDVTTRAMSRSDTHGAGGKHIDSLRTTIALRN
jgi:prepilin-type N-terminal cleavage/methylation domain-containing protein